MTFSLGRNKVKRGRSYNGYENGASGGALPTNPDALEYDDDLARDVQQFLKDRAYSVVVDGDWGRGSKRALAAFQKGAGLPGNGDWNKETAAKIASLNPGSNSGGAENIKDDQGRTKITVFAVVDPLISSMKQTSGTTCCRIPAILNAIDDFGCRLPGTQEGGGHGLPLFSS